METLADQRLHHIGPIESADYGDGGDVGDVGDLSAEAHVRKTHAGSTDIDEGERECGDFIKEPGGNGENVSHVSTASVTDTKSSNLTVETLDRQRLHQVSTTSPQRPHVSRAGDIDLAYLPDTPAVDGKDPP